MISKPMLIGLKYCGGCNPEYDRKALVDRFAQNVGNRVTFVGPDTPNLGGLLVIAGCRTACVDVDLDPSLPVLVVTDEKTGEIALEALNRLIGAGE